MANNLGGADEQHSRCGALIRCLLLQHDLALPWCKQVDTALPCNLEVHDLHLGMECKVCVRAHVCVCVACALWPHGPSDIKSQNYHAWLTQITQR